MLSNYSETSIELKPRPSAWMAWILAGAHITAAAVVILAVSFKPAAAALLLLALLSWYRAHRVHVQHRGARSIRRLVWQADGQWLLDDGRESAQPAHLLPSSYLHPRLVILNFRLLTRRGRRNLVLLPDSLDAQTLRQLRRRMRIESAEALKAGFNRA